MNSPMDTPAAGPADSPAAGAPQKGPAACQKPPVVAVVGPTATGKTRFGVELALALDGEVISCDSMQIYKGMSIGTAAPTQEERRGVPHHMIGTVSPAQPYSVADYCRDASACIAGVLSRGRLPILVGGTGLYADSLLDGLSYPELPDAQPLRARLAAQARREGLDALYRRLQQADPQTAARLHPNDARRIIRALEVYESTGQPMSELARRARGEPAYRCLRLGLDYCDRALLYERIDRRVDLMMEQGLLGEVRALAAQPGVQGGTALAAIGYKEFLPLLRGEGSLPDAVAAVKQASRRYAKRQRTWFYRHADTHWFYRDLQDDNSILSQMISLFHNTF